MRAITTRGLREERIFLRSVVNFPIGECRDDVADENEAGSLFLSPVIREIIKKLTLYLGELVAGS